MSVFDPDPMVVCAVCGRRCSLYVTEGPEGRRETWTHAGDDHVVVPVSGDDVPVVPRCDFCSREDPTWGYPVRERFDVVVTVEDTAATTHVHATGWTACDACSGFVERGDLRGLVHRALRALRQNHVVERQDERGTRDLLTTTYEAFFATRDERVPLPRRSA